jgi:hypothetical protein
VSEVRRPSLAPPPEAYARVTVTDARLTPSAADSAAPAPRARPCGACESRRRT